MELTDIFTSEPVGILTTVVDGKVDFSSAQEQKVFGCLKCGALVPYDNMQSHLEYHIDEIPPTNYLPGLGYTDLKGTT